MATFYQGYKTKNIVIQNYFNGKFLNSNGIMESLDLKTNKYNAEFIGRIYDINRLWYGTIIANKVVIKLIERNSNNEYTDINNIWRLIKAQSGTLKYNKLLRTSLRKYAITKQKIYNAIKEDLDKQDERIVRNRKLLIDLCKDYGLESVINLVEEENKMSIIEHIIYYTDSIGKDLIQAGSKETDEEVIEYYNEIVNAYMEYIDNLAKNNDKTLDNDISEGLQHYREVRDAKIRANKQEIADRKKNAKKDEALNNIGKDNIIIQNELNSSYDCKFKKLTEPYMARQLRLSIEKLNKEAYYIAVCNFEVIRYITDNGRETSSINKAKLFSNKEEAKEFIESLGKRLNVFRAVSIEKLVVHTLKSKDMKVYKLSHNSAIEEIKIKLSESGNDAILSVVKKSIYNNYIISGKLINKANIRVIWAENENHSGLVKDTNNSLEITNSLDDVKYFLINDNASDISFNHILNMLNNNNYKFYVHDLVIEREDIKAFIKLIDSWHSDLLRKIDNYVTGKNYNHNNKNLDKLCAMLDEKREQGIEQIYYIGCCNHRMYYSFNGKSMAYNINNKTMLTSNNAFATMFDNLEEAVSHLEKAFEASTVAKICSISTIKR